MDELFKIHLIDVDRIDDMTYNISERLRKWLKLMNAVTLSDAREAILGDEVMEKAVDKMEDFCDEYKEDIELFGRERYLRAIEEEKAVERGIEIGLDRGSQETKLETAKNMLKDNLDINTISKYTGLTLEEIEDLKE